MMMKTKSTILGFTEVFFIVDLCLIIYGIIFQNLLWLLNSQVAFAGSLLITIGSFFSYKKNIQNRLSNLDTSTYLVLEDRDKIDELNDSYDLYSEYIETKEEDLTPEKIKEILDDEKNKVKKNSLKNIIFSASGFLSIYRIAGYTFLVFGFFALNNNKIFLSIPFLIGLGIVSLSVLLSKFMIIKEEGQY